MWKRHIAATLMLSLLAVAQAHAQAEPMPEYFSSGQLPEANPLPRASAQGLHQFYNYSQQPNANRQWQNSWRNTFIYDQQAHNRWMQQQRALNYMKREQTFLRPMPNSTPMFAPSVPPAYLPGIQQRARRIYYGKQQILRQWHMAPYPW